jgi:cell division protein FtsB
MRQFVSRRVRDVATRLLPQIVAALDEMRVSLADQQRTIGRLRQRIEQLEVEVQECRALNGRIAELTDIVGELLVPAARRDEEKLGELLARYADRL